MGILIVAFTSALLAANGIRINHRVNPKPYANTAVNAMESAPAEDWHIMQSEELLDRDSMGKKNTHKKSKKRVEGAKAWKTSTRTIQSEGESIELESDEVLHPKLEAHLAQEGVPVVQTLKSDEGMAYYGEIRVGGQPQMGIYDTGSFDLVVLSACTKRQQHMNRKTKEPQCCTRKKCPKANYNSALSGNWVKDSSKGLEKVVYGSGPVSVSVGGDHVEFKATKGEDSISDTDVPTKVIVDHEVDLFAETDLQAIVGIGPGKFEERENRMLDHLQMRRFMVCFQQDANKDGYITWNDKDRSNDPAFKSVPVLGKLFWATKLVDFKLKYANDLISTKTFNTFEGCKDGCGAIIDTGTSLLTPPKEVIDEISEKLDNGHITDCSDMSKFPTLSFKLGEHELTLPPESYIGAVDDEEASFKAGFKHKALAFPLLPMKKKASNITLAFKQQEGATPIEMKQEFPRHGACAIMMSEGDPEDGTPWGPMVIFGMQLFRKYAVQFDMNGDIDGVKPSLSNPTRFMRFTEAAPDCSQDSQGKMFSTKSTELNQKPYNFKQKRDLQGSRLRVFNLKKIRTSSFQRHLQESRLDENYKVNGYKFRVKNMVRI